MNTLRKRKRMINFKQIARGVYVVRTQAGFKQAIKHWYQCWPEDIRGYPEKYPSVVSFSEGYDGGSWTVVSHCTHVNDMIRHLKERIRLIELYGGALNDNNSN
jgi:hypothetical protein